MKRTKEINQKRKPISVKPLKKTDDLIDQLSKNKLFNDAITLGKEDQYLIDLENYLITRLTPSTILEIKYRDLPVTVLQRIENDDAQFNNLKLISISIIVIIMKLLNLTFSDDHIQKLIIRVFYNLGIMEKLKSKPLLAKMAELNSKTINNDLMEIISNYTKDYSYKSEVTRLKEKIQAKATVKEFTKTVISNMQSNIENSKIANETQKEKEAQSSASSVSSSSNTPSDEVNVVSELNNDIQVQVNESNTNQDQELPDMRKPRYATLAMKLRENNLTEEEKKKLRPLLNAKPLTQEQLQAKKNNKNLNTLANDVAAGKIKSDLRNMFNWLPKEGEDQTADQFLQKLQSKVE